MSCVTFNLSILIFLSEILCHYLSRTAIVETLMNRVAAWEEERGIDFTYDGVAASHLPFIGTAYSK